MINIIGNIVYIAECIMYIDLFILTTHNCTITYNDV